MQECNIIKELYKSLKNTDFENFDKIYFSVRDGRCKFNVEEIVPLCELLTYDYDYIEPHQSLKIVNMTFLTIKRYEPKMSFIELVKGLKIIYNRSSDKKQEEMEEYIERYISSFLSEYKDEDISILGNIIKKDESKAFKEHIVAIVEESMEYYAEDDYVAKCTMLIECIKCYNSIQ